jgi:hypothetical protein
MSTGRSVSQVALMLCVHGQLTPHTAPVAVRGDLNPAGPVLTVGQDGVHRIPHRCNLRQLDIDRRVPGQFAAPLKLHAGRHRHRNLTPPFQPPRLEALRRRHPSRAKHFCRQVAVLRGLARLVQRLVQLRQAGRHRGGRMAFIANRKAIQPGLGECLHGQAEDAITMRSEVLIDQHKANVMPNAFGQSVKNEVVSSNNHVRARCALHSRDVFTVGQERTMRTVRRAAYRLANVLLRA